MFNDDSDIKIFGKSLVDDKNEAALLLEQVNRQRANGNTEKARKLGVHLAEIFLNDEEINSHIASAVGKIPSTEYVMEQVRILIVFSAQWCLSHRLPAALLSNTAVNSFYDKISQTKDVYDDLSDGPEFSFYSLAVRQAETSAQAIGETFKKLCDRDNDESNDEDYVELGKRIYNKTVEEVVAIIDKFNFTA
ncbi:MAG: hypothetical protein E7515_06650 [Ruminococcaceae bacterium]|jgi:hypothetical protein|nr:hypothetical protein [Oscillospiraceae bacterium]